MTGGKRDLAQVFLTCIQKFVSFKAIKLGFLKYLLMVFKILFKKFPKCDIILDYISCYTTYLQKSHSDLKKIMDLISAIKSRLLKNLKIYF